MKGSEGEKGRDGEGFVAASYIPCGGRVRTDGLPLHRWWCNVGEGVVGPRDRPRAPC